MTHIQFLVVASMLVIPACKSRYGFTEGNKEAATAGSNNAIPSPGARTTTQSSTSTPSSEATDTSEPNSTVPSSTPSSVPSSTPSNETTSTVVEPAPTMPGGPVAGIEVWQDGKLVTTIQTGKSVSFKPTAWTRDTSTTSGCDVNPGIVQASWTIGSRQAADLQRYAGQDCRLFDYSGTFTKPGQVVVQLDVISGEGEQAHAQMTLTVAGDTMSTPTSSTTQGTPQAPQTSPVQK